MSRKVRLGNRELKHQSAFVRREAVRALGAHDPGPQRRRLSWIHRRTTGTLVKVARVDADESVRLAAAETLIGYTDPVAREAVLELLGNAEGTPSARKLAVRALELRASDPILRAAAQLLLRVDETFDLRSVDTTELLILLLEQGGTDENGDRASIVAAVAPWLADSAGARAIPPLVRELLNDKRTPGSDSSVAPISPRECRLRAEQELAAWAWRPDPNPDGVLASEQPGQVARALISFGAPAGEATLEAVRAAPNLSDEPLERAASVLAELADTAPDLITTGLAATEPAVVRLAAAAVGIDLNENWMPGLVTAAGSSQVNVQATALAALGRVTSFRPADDDARGEAVRCLLDHILDEAPGPRRAALEALGRATMSDVSLPLSGAMRLEALMRERPMLLPRVVGALRWDPFVTNIVVRLIREGTPDQRRYALMAVRAIAFLGTPAVSDEGLESVVTSASKDDDPSLSSLATSALSALLAARQPTGAFLPIAIEAANAESPPPFSRGRRFRFSLPRRRRRSIVIRQSDELQLLLESPDNKLTDIRVGSMGAAFLAAPSRSTRYPDISLLTDAPEPQLLPAGIPLREATWYRVEAAIRSEVVGLPLSEGARGPLPDLPETTGVNRLLVAADSDDFEIDDPLGHITLPTAAGDSVENACFRVRARRATPAGEASRIELRLYYEYNLIEVILFEAQVRPRLTSLGQPPSDGAPPVATIQVSRERDLEDLGEVAPRAMNISVDRDGDRYALTFAFPAGSRETVLRGVTAVGADDLDSELVSLRELWRDIALSSPFVDEVKPSAGEAEHELSRLVDSGRRLWTMLFRLEVDSGLGRIGELLESHPLPSSAKIQISVGPQAGTFSFPWGLLYDRDPASRGERPDPEGFWGARYVIEQGVPGLMRARDAESESRASSLEFAYMLWNRFRNAREHSLMLAGLETSAGSRLRISAPPVLDADSCLDLLSQGYNDILYFYTHGFTRRRNVSTSDTEELNRLKHWYEGLDANDPRRVSLRSLYETLTDGAPTGRSYISFPFSRLYLDDLYGRIRRLHTTPAVILNMCESAQVSPTLSDSFVHFFLSRGARSVIGTECPMTVAFAHPFAEEFLSHLFRGTPIGESLLATRRGFLHTASNPLGLAYTLYGSAMTSFVPPLLDAGVQDLSTNGAPHD